VNHPWPKETTLPSLDPSNKHSNIAKEAGSALGGGPLGIAFGIVGAGPAALAGPPGLLAGSKAFGILETCSGSWDKNLPLIQTHQKNSGYQVKKNILSLVMELWVLHHF